MPEPIITISKPKTETALSRALFEAFETAIGPDFTVAPEIAAIPGMSGQRYRCFINTLIKKVPDPRYLEIGSWMGSTLCSAVHGNKVNALAIDNWSEFGGPVAGFFANVAKVASSENRVSVLNSDFRAVNYGILGKFNVYLFDGPHSEQDHYDGMAMPMDALDDEFVLVIDDWNWERVRTGTFKAMERTGLKVYGSVEVLTSNDDVHPGLKGQLTDEKSEWHNGYVIATVKKN